MKMKRIISIVVLSLFASLFQSMPAANAAAPGKPAFSGANCEVAYSDWSFTMTSTTAVTGFKYAFTTNLETSAPATFYDFNGTYTQNGNSFVIRFVTSDYAAANKTDGQARPWIKGLSGADESAINNNSFLSCPLPTAGDTTAPTLSSVSASSVTNAGATLNFTSNEAGTYYYVIYAATQNVPTSAAVVAGTNSIQSGNGSPASGARSKTITGLTGGTAYTAYIVVKDAAGNNSLVSPVDFTTSVGAPTTLDLASASDLGSSSTDNNTSDDTPTFSLAGLITGASVTLTATPVSGSAVTCTFTATATTGSCTFPALGNETYSVAATQTSNSVTSSASTALTGIVINKSTLTVPSTPDLDTASDIGSSTSDNITSDKTPKINVSGSFSGTAVVTATKGSTSVSCTISTGTCDLPELADGTWSVSVTDTDTAGNARTSAALSITVDATAPTPTVAAVSVTTANGVTVRSSEIGTAYLVKTTITVNGLSDITSAADDSMNQVTISSANTDTAMSTAGLVAGDYKLYVVDAAGNLSSFSGNTVTVAVAAAPTSTSTSAPTGTTTFGSTLTNAVTFAGVPSPTQLTYQWKSCTSATDTATACTDISGATSSSFIANAVDLVGKFIRVLVTAINGISPNGSALSSPTAAITPVAPGVPVVGTPTKGDLQINVPVTAPASNGGSTILKYQFSTDGGTTWMDRTDTATVSSPVVIKFLSTDGTTPIVAGTAYPVQIRAVNGATPAESAGSASISVTAVTAPAAPTAVSATATGQTTASVTFTAPTSNGGSAITSYTVTSSPGGITATGSTSPIAVTGLSSGTTYTFTIVANNGAINSVASGPSASIATLSPPPPPACDASCEAAAAKVIADRIASDTAAKVVAEKVTVDKSAAEAAAKAAVDKAAAAVVAKAAADAAAVNAAAVAKAAADAQQAAIVAAEKAAATLKSSTTTAAAKAAATATAVKAASTAANTVQAAAAAAKVAATAKNNATNANKQVDIALGALGSKTAAAASAAQANAIAAAAKAAANAAAKAATDAAAAAKVASNNANREAANTAASIATEQKLAADAAAEAKIATDALMKATEEKIEAAAEAQKNAEAVVKALDEKIVLAEASVKAIDLTERAAIDKKIAEINVKIAEAQKLADAANIKAEATVLAQEKAQAAVVTATQTADTQAARAIAVRTESITKNAAATKATADASLAAKIATAAVAAAARVPSKAVIAAKPTKSTKKNSAQATITGLKPGQKVKVTVNVKGK